MNELDLNQHDGNVSVGEYVAHLHAVPITHPSTIHIELAAMDDLRAKCSGFKTVVLHRGDERHEYEIDDLLARLDRMHPPTAERASRTNDGLTGHCECTACGWPIDPFDAYCRHCGAKLTDPVEEGGDA